MYMTKTIITIARQYGSGGRLIGKKLSEILEIPFYDKELIDIAAKKSGMSEEVFARADERASSSLLYSLVMGSYSSPANNMPINDKLFLLQADIIKEAAKQGPFVIVGRCADYILREEKPWRIFVFADIDARIARCHRRAPQGEVLTDKEMKQKINSIDKGRAKYYEFFTGSKWGDRKNYDYLINTTNIAIKEFVPHLAKLFEDLK